MRWRLALGAALVLLAPAFTTPRCGAASVAALESIPLNGAPQAVLRRGADRSAPVVVFLHGGPGASSMPFYRRYTSDLEEDFLVVHWDQPGAGGSCSAREHRSVAQIVADLDALIDALGVERVALVGQSWGTIPGALYVRAHPERVWAYAAEGQLVDQAEAERLGHAALLSAATGRADAATLAQLSRLKPPYSDVYDAAAHRRLLMREGWVLVSGWSLGPVLGWSLVSPELSVPDKLRYGWCMADSARAMQAEIQSFTLTDRGPWPVPTAFFSGRHDQVTPVALVEALAASSGAEFTAFEGSAHVPSLEEPQRFQASLRDFLLRARAASR